MDAFMKSCKSSLSKSNDYTEVHIVMGNTACDLDSVVSALVYGFYLWNKKVADGNTAVIPLLNISQKELRMRNEVMYFLKKCEVDIDNLCFKENIDFQSLHDFNKLKLILVDHNELDEKDSSFNSSVVEIIDHHSVENNIFDKEKMNIEMVGSCCTLVAEKLLQDRREIIDNQVALLLLGTILLDTVNLDDKAKRVTEKDKIVAAQLKEFLPHIDPAKLFTDIQEAKFDTSGLSVSDLLRKDFKMVTSKMMNIIVPSLNVLVETVLKYPEIEHELEELRVEHQCHVVVMMGIIHSSGEIVRQIAVYSHIGTYRDQIVEALQTSNENLSLVSFPSGFSSIAAFSQGNYGASRKVVLPVLQRFTVDGLSNRKNTDFCKFPSCPAQNETLGSSITQHQPNVSTRVLSDQKVIFTNSDGSQGETSPAIGETNELFLGAPHQFLGAGDPWSTVTSSKNSSNQNSCPYTPLNSVAESESGIDQYAMHILPSFNSRDMLEKIAKKRNKLGEYVGDLSVTDTYPYTPKNSYVEGSFESYAKGLPHFDAQTLFLKVEEQKCTQEHGVMSPTGFADRGRFADCIAEESERTQSSAEENSHNGVKNTNGTIVIGGFDG